MKRYEVAELVMKTPPTIQFLGMAPTDALQASTRQHIEKLELLAPDLMACRATLELSQKHQQQGRPFSVRLDVTLPGLALVVSRVQNEEMQVALRDAFDSMKRQIEDAVRKRRGQVKHHSLPNGVSLGTGGAQASDLV
jgi:ribosome-associated translation inhibitor RaiA